MNLNEIRKKKIKERSKRGEAREKKTIKKEFFPIVF